MKFTESNGVLLSKFNYEELHVSTDESKGFKPLELLISSIVGCITPLLCYNLSQKDIDFSEIEADVEVKRGDKKHNKVEKIHIHCLIKGCNVNVDHIESSIQYYKNNCDTVQSLTNSIKITEIYELIWMC